MGSMSTHMTPDPSLARLRSEDMECGLRFDCGPGTGSNYNCPLSSFSSTHPSDSCHHFPLKCLSTSERVCQVSVKYRQRESQNLPCLHCVDAAAVRHSASIQS